MDEQLSLLTAGRLLCLCVLSPIATVYIAAESVVVGGLWISVVEMYSLSVVLVKGKKEYNKSILMTFIVWVIVSKGLT